MRWRTELPRPVREREHVWIPLPGGTRLAARVWLPEDAERAPVPALLEAVPYRKTDGTALGDPLRHRYFAGHGYASVRVDVRGSGDSDGLLRDEYGPQELADGVATLDWLAAQPWCTGRVGLFGISWGGIAALKIAARRPAALGAVVAACATDDRYADDVHYRGGALVAHDAVSWATLLLALSALPPDARRVPAWRERWHERLAAASPPLETWLAHPDRDAYWTRDSVADDPSAIRAPVLAVGGWADPYRNAVFRLLERLDAPVRAIVGPWAHGWPEAGAPGPATGFLQECVRWWDRWLKDRDTGADREPALRAYLQESARPSTRERTRPGRWISEPDWPAPAARIGARALFLSGRGLRDAPPVSESLAVPTRLAHGAHGGVYCPFGARSELPGDQRDDDARALSLDAEPAVAREEILGRPRVSLRVATDRPLAQLHVRLCDVAPDGESALVTRGVLNLAQRASRAAPEPLVPGTSYDVTLALDAIAHALPPGHRWRLAVAPTGWPLFWPPPEPVTLRLETGPATRLELPVRAPQPGEEEPRFGPPEACPPAPHEWLRPPRRSRRHEREGVRLTYFVESDAGRLRLTAPDTVSDSVGRDAFAIREDDPGTAELRSHHAHTLERGGVATRVEATGTLRAGPTQFEATAGVAAWEDGAKIFERTWRFRAPRGAS